MRRIAILTSFLGLFAVLALADNFSGNLIDAACLAKENPTVATCQPTSSTTAFALVDNSRKVYKFDEKGNSKAANALKNRADRSADPNSPSQPTVVVAKVTGTITNGVVTVDAIEIQ